LRTTSPSLEVGRILGLGSADCNFSLFFLNFSTASYAV
jgi:hypothetical protein